MNIIFLDIDGVLNTMDTFKDIYYEKLNIGYKRIEIDEKRLVILSKIVENTNSKIVLSSTWRMFFKKIDNIIYPINDKAEKLIELFKKYNLEIYDITSFSSDRKRQTEIEEYINCHDINNFIILDDNSNNLEKFINSNLILINNGLEEKHISKCKSLIKP